MDFIVYTKKGMSELNIVECPHPDCKQTIEVVEMNCRIFRCGVFKHDFKQIDPHLPKEQCDKLVADGVIYGCGRPFQIVLDASGCNQVIICGYI